MYYTAPYHTSKVTRHLAFCNICSFHPVLLQFLEFFSTFFAFNDNMMKMEYNKKNYKSQLARTKIVNLFIQDTWFENKGIKV